MKALLFCSGVTHGVMDTLSGSFFAPHPPPQIHFYRKGRITGGVSDQELGHAHRMSCLECEMANLLLEATPPDQDMVELIEQAFSEGQIDCQNVALT